MQPIHTELRTGEEEGVLTLEKMFLHVRKGCVNVGKGRGSVTKEGPRFLNEHVQPVHTQRAAHWPRGERAYVRNGLCTLEKGVLKVLCSY